MGEYILNAITTIAGTMQNFATFMYNLFDVTFYEILTSSATDPVIVTSFNSFGMPAWVAPLLSMPQVVIGEFNLVEYLLSLLPNFDFTLLEALLYLSGFFLVLTALVALIKRIIP